MADHGDHRLGHRGWWRCGAVHHRTRPPGGRGSAAGEHPDREAPLRHRDRAEAPGREGARLAALPDQRHPRHRCGPLHLAARPRSGDQGAAAVHVDHACAVRGGIGGAGGRSAGGYCVWTQEHKQTIEKIGAARSEADSLERIVAAAKADLASGSIEDLRRRVEEYQGSLELMRRLVPDRNEVPTLIDDISTKAKVRGVTLGKIQPLAPEPGSPFDTYRYRLEVYGHYDQIGEYLADVASLPRIVVPQDVILSFATPAVQKLLGDTAGALLLAEFSIRTFVKSAAPPPPAGKPAGAGPARS